MLACFSIKDNDSLSRQIAQAQPQIIFSEEILIEKRLLDATLQRIQTLKNDIALAERKKDLKMRQEIEEKDAMIRELEAQHEAEKA